MSLVCCCLARRVQNSAFPPAWVEQTAWLLRKGNIDQRRIWMYARSRKPADQAFIRGHMDIGSQMIRYTMSPILRDIFRQDSEAE